MFKAIYLNEFKKNLKSIPFYIFTLAILIIVYIFASNTNPGSYMLGLNIVKEWHNAPILIARMMAHLSALGVLFTMIMVGRTVTKDFDAKIHDFFFTMPMSKISFLGGRFFGGLSANILIYSGVILGFILGCLVLDPKLYGPFQISAFTIPALIILIPNLLFIGIIFFSLATLSRKMLLTYVAGIAFIMIYGIAIGGFYHSENDTFKILADPFGVAALGILTKYWTVSDMNQNLMPVHYLLIINRIIWLFVTFAIAFFTMKKFKFVSVLEGKKAKMDPAPGYNSMKNVVSLGTISSVEIIDTFFFQLQKCFHFTWREFRRIVFHPAFLILTFMGMSEIVSNFILNVGDVGSNVYPLTSWYLEHTMHIWIYMIPLTILFSGMIIWRERENGSNEFYDTLPVPDWMVYLSKLFTMMSIQLFYVTVAMLLGILTQFAVFGYTDFEIGLYVKQLFGIELFKYWFMTIIVFMIHNIVKNKYMGFFISAVYFIADLIIFNVLEFNNFLFRYGQIPAFKYSNINGFGHYSQTIIWYTIYWGLLALILAQITSLLWRRNNETSLKYRFRSGFQKLTRINKLTLSILLILFLTTGTYIAYNKYVINQHLSKDENLVLQADYEKKYSKYKDLPQPKIVDINLKMDIYPEKRKVFIKGFYILQNKTKSLISEIYLHLSDRYITEINDLELSVETSLIHQGKEFGFRILKLHKPMNPGEQIQLDFDLIAEAKGFTENNPKDRLSEKGTYLIHSSESPDYFPLIGYNPALEIYNSDDRKKHNLPPREKEPNLQNVDRSRSLFQTDLTKYEAIIGTCSDQVVVSNGNLIRQWQDQNRNYFHYKSEVAMANEIVFVSSDYQVARDKHKDIDIEIYYDKKHAYNIDRMIKGIKQSYDYCTVNFCPFPYEVIRIVEIPLYVGEGGAMSTPTVFTWKENAGFIINFEDPESIDMVFAITTHELAHQWWGYIVNPARAEGSFLLAETMAQYVETMCMEKEYGKKISGKFLEKEMKSYLSRRKKDIEGELPLMRTNIEQHYLNYQKSTVVMYALQHYIGEHKVNEALRNIVEQYGHREDIYPTSLDVVNEFKKVTPDSLQYLVTDLFEKITLYENKVISATSTQLEDGKYKVNLNTSTQKFYADSVGNQVNAPLNDYIIITVYDENDKELYSKYHKFTQAENEIEIMVNQKPFRAGIDPKCILIDRERKNNITNIDWL